MKKFSLIFITMLIALFAFPQIGKAAEPAGEVTGQVSFASPSYHLRDLIILGVQSGVIPDAVLGGQRAFCMDPGKDASSTVIYTRGEKVTDSRLIRAYNYGRTGTDIQRAYTQAYMWGITTGHSTSAQLKIILVDVIDEYYKQKGITSTKSEELSGAEIFLKVIDQQTVYDDELYIWNPSDPSYQRFIGGPTGDSTTCSPITSINAGRCCDLPEAPGLPGYDEWCKNPPTGNRCPDPTVSIADCNSNSEYHDPNLTDWECVKGVDQYKETNQNSVAVSHNYCTIYCREDAYTAFPGGGYTFGAGRYFTVGSSNLGPTWGPVCIKGQRECRTFWRDGSKWKEGINFEKFAAEYKSVNSRIVSLWGDYQRKKLQAEMPERPKPNLPLCGAERVPDDQGFAPTRKISWDTDLAGNTVQKGYYYTCVGGGPAGAEQVGDGETSWCYRLKWRDGYHIDSNCKGDYCGPAEDYCEQGRPGKRAAEAAAAYNSAVGERTSYIEAIKSCVTMNTNYKMDPDVKFNYPDDKSYSTTGLQLKESISTSVAGPSNNGTTFKFDTHKDCNSEYHLCRDITLTIDKIVNSTENRKVDSANACYSLPDDYYRYVYKINGECYTQSMINDDITWIRLNDTYVPVTTTMLPGSYHLGLTYTNIGNIASGTAHFDQYVSKTTGTTISEYICDYNIDNGLLCGASVCDTKATGIDIIYRPISLSAPFPGKSGRGRSTGSNWCSGSDCSNTNSVVNSVITKNRGVTTDSVYNLEPIYSATLTPNIIKSIRAYNRSKNYDYGDFNLVCEKGAGGTTGKKCISSFIHSSDYSSLFSGSCANASASQFDSCR